MTFEEAVIHKKEALQNADESILRLYHIIISPSNTDESYRYIEAFCKNPDAFSDESCREFCTDDDFEVVSFKKNGDGESN